MVTTTPANTNENHHHFNWSLDDRIEGERVRTAKAWWNAGNAHGNGKNRWWWCAAAMGCVGGEGWMEELARPELGSEGSGGWAPHRPSREPHAAPFSPVSYFVRSQRQRRRALRFFDGVYFRSCYLDFFFPFFLTIYIWGYFCFIFLKKKIKNIEHKIKII